MYLFDLKNYLQRLNPDLWIDESNRSYNADKENGHSGLYYKDKMLLGVPHQFLPEFSVVDETNHIVRRGWRPLLIFLVKGGYIDKRRTEKLIGRRLDEYIRR